MRRLALAAVLLLGACGKGDAGAKGADKGAPPAAGTSAPKPADVPAKPSAPAPAAIEAPTAAECDAAIANMKTFMPDEVHGDADDKAHCMSMPRPVVQCLQRAKSVQQVDSCVDSYEAAHAGPDDEGAEAVAPEPRASEADCQKAIANVRKIVPDAPGDAAQQVKDCTTMATVSEVKCLIDAKSEEDIDHCDTN